MKIIINELKKIFTLKMTALLLLGSTIFYLLFTYFYIDVFPNGRPELDDYNISVQMLNDYGNEMDETEFENFKNIYNERLKEADNFLSNNQDFNEVGVYSYDDYINAEVDLREELNSGKESNKNVEDVKWKYLDKEEGTIFWELQEYSNHIDFYELRDNYEPQHLYSGEKREKRINEIITNNENESILPVFVFDNYNELIIDFGVSIILGIAFMLTPIFLRDKRDKINYLQYSSKHGRKLFKSKLIAGFIASLIITTIELIICFILYKGNNTSMFFGCNINSVFNYEFWFNLTFAQYIGITIVSVYIISIITAFISMFISSKVRTYIAGIGIQVPILFAIIKIVEKYLINNMFMLYKHKYLEVLIYLVLIVVTAAAIVKSNRKEKSLDIRN